MPPLRRRGGISVVLRFYVNSCGREQRREKEPFFFIVAIRWEIIYN